MGFDVKVTVPPNPGIEIQTAIRRGLKEAGDEVLLASDVLAPREPVARHGIHMTETGFVRVQPGVDSDAVDVGYEAFWAVLQHENLAYHHPDGGVAKFLERALVGGNEAAMETIAANVRAVTGA